MPKTKIKTKPLINLKVGILLTTFLLLVTTALWTAKFYFSSIILTGENLPTVTLSDLGTPLIDFPLLEGTGTTVRSRGSITNLSASFEGNKISWQKTPEPVLPPQEDPNLLQSTEGLIGYWKLNNNLEDTSGNAVSAITKSGTTVTSNFCSNDIGLINQGCDFGSVLSQNLDISNIGGLVNPRSGSISIWVNPNSLAVNRYIVYGTGSGKIPTYQVDRYNLEWHGNYFKFIRGNSGGTINVTNNVEQNKWHHLVMSWDESNVYAYLNGQFVSSTTYTLPDSNTPRFFIGNWQNNIGRPFTGKIDEVAFFNRKITNEEVTKIYNDTNNIYNQATTTLDNQKYVYLNNTAHDAYGQLRINTHTQIQQLNLPSKITISGEIYLTEYPKDYELFTIYSDTTVLGQGNTLAINSQGQAVLNANTGNTRYLYTAGNSPVALNQWVQISGSFNSETNEMLIQVNNSEFGTDAPQKTENIKRSFTIRPIIGNTNYWRNGLRGHIRNIKIWNKSILSGQFAVNSFITPIKSGFERDLATSPKARWLGAGSLNIININAQHPNHVYEIGPEGNLFLTGTASFEELKTLRLNNPIENKKTVSWAAWTNADGIINIAINSKLEDSEALTIKGITEKFNDWFVDIKDFIGPRRISSAWINQSNFQISHLILDTVTDPNNSQAVFEESLTELIELKIFENIQIK